MNNRINEVMISIELFLKLMVLCIPFLPRLRGNKKSGAYLMPTSQIAKHSGGILDLRKEKLRPYNQDQLRAKIQVSQIMNILHDHVVNGTDIAHTRLTTGLALLKKVLPDALPDAVTNNLQSQAIESIAKTQLVAMAQEMLRQGQIDASTLTEDSCKIAEDAHVIESNSSEHSMATDEIVAEISEQSLTLDK